MRSTTTHALYTSLVVTLLTACGPVRVSPLPPPDGGTSSALVGRCITVRQVADNRSDKAVLASGAFNMFKRRPEGDQLLTFVRGEFRAAASRQSADVVEDGCSQALDISIVGFLFDEAWGWPVTAHTCSVAVDADLIAGPRHLRRHLASEMRSRQTGDVVVREMIPDGEDETARCLREQLRKLATSYFEDGEVQALLRTHAVE